MIQMSKKQVAKQYIIDNTDWESLKKAYQNSWLVEKPFNWLLDNGIVVAHTPKIKDVIAVAGYKHTESDSTWERVIELRREVIQERAFYLKN